ncbi:hypothetical protein ACIBP6_35875 [Nonomuraea terrae]|uniref:hypothetical protein n=1 Tax=Nonomuraea terrae TaxID=2530383 RepID=UPI0037ACBB34
MTTPVNGRAAEHERPSGVSVAVREDTRPVIAYRRLRDAALALLDCRSADCARADEVPLTGRGHTRTRPALVLDRGGGGHWWRTRISNAGGWS